MINIKKGYILCEKHNIPYLNFCKQCEKIFFYYVIKQLIKITIFQKKHIDNFNKNITIKTRTSIKKIH